MARVVDRLLAQLPGLQGTVDPGPPAFRSSALEIHSGSGHYVEPPTLIGLWGRVVLGLTLGLMMTAWPYFRECGLPLYGYLCAVAAVVVALVPLVTLNVLGAFTGPLTRAAANGMVLSLALLLMPTLFASFYASYRDVFGAPDPAETSPGA